MSRLIATLLLFFAAAVASPADAQQRRSAANEQREAEAGVTLAQYQRALAAAASEAGAEAAPQSSVAEHFAAADADGNGTLDAAEVAAAERRENRCDGNGVCRYGQCFCASQQAGGEQELVDEEMNHTAQENPTFIAPSGANNNAIGQK